ncbi:MAG: valine--tRNA ligase [Candidatus Paceibacterota bacterium]
METKINEKLLKPYNPKETEDRIYQTWEKSGFFNPDNLPGKREKKFTVMIAPPNITGSLHMGHALENTLSDIVVRFHRMRGYKTLWLPGTDHAGIATQNVVEKDLKKQGISRHDLGREKFIEKIWEWREKYGNIILDQLKKLGCSADWSRTRFTMDEKYQEAVKEAFNHYYKKGLIYQGERVVNWCVKDQTALSDLELEYKEEKSKLWHIKYPIKDSKEFIVVATTRPETMLGDTAVAVNPKDARYKNLLDKKVILPLVNREIPIVADHAIDMEFGTGAVKVTPAHDMTDSEIAFRHDLPFIKIINEIGRMINTTADFDGLKITEARTKVVEELQKLGLLEKEEDFTHNIAKCYRCDSTVEPMLSKQWFLKMKPLAEKAIKAIENGEIDYYPERWKDVSIDWLKNVRDWCISRQIWWGHRIPIEGEESTFDTWFSSALWPFATLGWPDKNAKDFKEFYPTQFITSARDILHLWISRMIFSGLEFNEKVPYGKILIHATIQTKDGKRMSKSLGTGIDPLELINKYGADATRFGLAYQEFGGQEIRFGEDTINMGKKFSNKLWNITRFVLTKTENKISLKSPDDLKSLTEEDKKLIEALKETTIRVTKNIEDFKFGDATHALYDFIWHDFADVYIEYSKDKNDESTNAILSYALSQIIKLLHPFMPFITEEIWSILPIKDEDLLIIQTWPEN